METKQLSVALLQVIANYLSTKPYNEVIGILNELQKQVNTKPEDIIKEENEEKND